MGWTDDEGGMSATVKQHVLVDCFLKREEQDRLGWRPALDNHLRPYAWRPGSDDVKVIFAVDDESAARIAVRARMDLNEMSEAQAVEHVYCRDDLRRIDPDAFFQGESPLWDGPEKVGRAVKKV
jgi:hypothetical protein